MFTVYTIPGCMFCKETVDTFKNRNINYKNIVVTTEKKKNSLKKKHKHNSFPQIIFNKKFIGGNDNLQLIIKQCDVLNNVLDNAFKNIPQKDLNLFLNLSCELSPKKNACRLKSICGK